MSSYYSSDRYYESPFGINNSNVLYRLALPVDPQIPEESRYRDYVIPSAVYHDMMQRSHLRQASASYQNALAQQNVALGSLYSAYGETATHALSKPFIAQPRLGKLALLWIRLKIRFGMFLIWLGREA